MAQCRTLTLVTSVEVLQSLSKRDASESKPGGPCSLSCPCDLHWHGPTPTIKACRTLSQCLQDTDFRILRVQLLSFEPLHLL